MNKNLLKIYEDMLFEFVKEGVNTTDADIEKKIKDFLNKYRLTELEMNRLIIAFLTKRRYKI